MNRRLKYSLCSLIFLMTIVCFLAAFLASRRTASQRKSIATLNAAGARVRMASESRSMFAKRFWWLPGGYTPVGDIQAGGILNFSDDDLSPVLALPEVRVLELQNTAVTDAGIKQLATAEMPNLRSINLSGTSLTGDGLLALATLPDLTDVVVNEGQFTTADVDAFRKRCRHFVRLHGLQ
jgi:hypothetical protein